MDALHRAEGLKRERFQQAWRAIGARDGHAFRTVQECYGEPHRAYHGQAHIAECLAWLDQLWEHARRPAELEIAIYFHDVVYDPGAADNEARSAALFSTLALDAGARPEAIERIALLIQSTREHVAEGGDAALLSDIDLAILGSSPCRYRRYVEQVRSELSFVPDEMWRRGRAAFLREMLARLCIYNIPQMSRQLEGQARRNMEAELNELCGVAKGGGRARGQ